jgi:hypothetical protein
MAEKEEVTFTVLQFIGIIIVCILFIKLEDVMNLYFTNKISSRTSNILLMLFVVYVIWIYIATGKFPLHSKSYYWNKSPDIVVAI